MSPCTHVRSKQSLLRPAAGMPGFLDHYKMYACSRSRVGELQSAQSHRAPLGCEDAGRQDRKLARELNAFQLHDDSYGVLD